MKNLLGALVLGSVLVIGCGGGQEASEGPGLEAAQSALTMEQCLFFHPDDSKITICHATSSTKNPWVIIRINKMGCGGHENHAEDWIDTTEACAANPKKCCQEKGCYPELAPYDGTVECCFPMVPRADEQGLMRCTNPCDFIDVDDGKECTIDTCDRETGLPVNTPVDAGVLCGDQETDTECDKPDTCDGAGECLPNYLPEGTECLPSYSECGGPGYCTGTSPGCPDGVVVRYDGGPYDPSGLVRSHRGYYRVVRIGAQCWFRDNLNVGTMVNAAQNQGDYSPTAIQKYCFNNEEAVAASGIAHCSATDGGFYQWHMAMALPWAAASNYWYTDDTTRYQGLCPAGWHLPSNAEWATLENAVGGGATAARHMKSAPPVWDGLDTYGFSAVPGGWLSDAHQFSPLGGATHYWSSSRGPNWRRAWTWFQKLMTGTDATWRSNYVRYSGMFVRCIQD